MSALNSSSMPSSFLLIGMPGLENAYGWISIPFCLLFLTSFFGNGLVLLVITRDNKLHQPMYLFLSMVAICDFMFSLSTSPSVLGIYWCNSQAIGSQICLLQMFFIHSLSVIESALLVAMAFDRFVAICHPLRYTAILTNSAISKIGLASALRGTVIHIPPIGSLRFLPYCKGNMLSHSYCLHQDVMKLACEGTNVFNIVYGLVVTLCTVTLDLVLVILSYIMIVKEMLGLTSDTERYKSFNICISHLCAVCLFYIPMVSLSLIHRFGHIVSPLFTQVMANAYLLAPPMLNPIIYSIKSKQIQVGFRRVFHPMKVRQGSL